LCMPVGQCQLTVISERVLIEFDVKFDLAYQN